MRMIPKDESGDRSLQPSQPVDMTRDEPTMTLLDDPRHDAEIIEAEMDIAEGRALSIAQAREKLASQR